MELDFVFVKRNSLTGHPLPACIIALFMNPVFQPCVELATFHNYRVSWAASLVCFEFVGHGFPVQEVYTNLEMSMLPLQWA